MTSSGASELRIEGLTAEVDGRQILNGIDRWSAPVRCTR
jgi:hypothetical protein